MRKWAFIRQGYKLNPSFSTASIVVVSGLMGLLTSDLLLSLSYGLKSTESATSIMVPNSEGAAYFGRFHPNGLLPAHHLRKVNLSGDRLLGAGVEAF